jgi:signal transduction histidine kinase/DNA-binding response OmpR family regulator/ligand-binding sensor domain-containing protein
MLKATPFCSTLTATFFSVIIFSSCSSRVVDIPFPVSDSGYPQPVVQPLKLTAAKKLDWITVKTGTIKPTVKKLDLSTLPSTPYDPSGFKPFPKPPVKTSFEMNSLRDSAFNLDSIPSKSLNLKTIILHTPVVSKAAAVSPKAGTTLSISDWGGTLGFQGKSVLCLIKDRTGLIWIGTDKGLERYDGEYIQSYQVSDGIAGLIEDNNGMIWAINDNGMGMIDTRKGIIKFTVDISTPYPRLPKMIVDHKGRIWVNQLGSHGVDIVDPQSGTFKHLDNKTGISGSNTWGTFEDDKNNIWIATNGGIDLINSVKGTVSYLNATNGLAGDTIRAITGDRKGRIWIAYLNGGLASIDAEHGTIVNYHEMHGFERQTTFRLLSDKNDRIWMASNHGLYIIDPLREMVQFVTDYEGITKDLILDIMFDKGKTWVATLNTGLYQIDQDAQMVYPLGKLSITTLYEDESGKIWGGTNGSGIIILDGNKKTSVTLNKQAGFNDNIIQSVQEVDGKVWVTSDGGLDKIDQKNKLIEHLGKKEGLLTDTIYNVLKDSKGNTWITGPSEGIELIDSSKTSIRRLTMANGLSDNTVTHIKEDQNGQIWIATSQGGVDIIDPDTWTVRYLNEMPGLKDTCYRVILPDKFGRMWIGTDMGIYIADLKKGIITTIDKKNGLSNNYISSLKEYQDYVVAAAHNKVNIIKPPIPNKDSNAKKTAEIWRVSQLSKSEGLVLSVPSWDVNIITKNGRYYWGDNGVTIINEIKEEQDSPNTFITGMNIMNEPLKFTNTYSIEDKDTLRMTDTFFVKGQTPVNTGYVSRETLHWDSVTGPYNMPVNLTIPYDQNFMQFQFTQAHLGRQDLTLYSYILLGIDKKWSSFENKTFTDNYLNFPPGNYIFKVRSKDISGTWTQPASLSFTILPPWWKTWWAYTIFVLLFVGIVSRFVQYRSKKLIRENRVLEDKVLARTIEVKQQAEELSTVNQISQALVSQADLHDLIKLVGDRLHELFKANIVYIALLDKKTRIINFPYQYGDKMPPLKLGEGLTSKIILSGQPMLINKDVDELTSSMGIDRVGIPAASYLGVPIPVSDEIIGVLSIQSTETENRFAEKDKRLLTTIAANVGVAIRKARLFEEVKLANTDADQARKNAEEANAAKSAFLSTVSHELRTPLTSVLGFAKITRKRLEEKIFPITDKSDPKTIKIIEQITGNLNVVIAEGERLTNLINDVLDLAKIEAGKMEWNMEPVRIPDIVERAIAATSSLFDQKNLKLERKIEEDLPEVSGDRDKLIQVVVNLLSNAVKFTNAGAVTCSVFQRDGGIIVGISDTGIGIAPEDHAKVFEQFKQVGDTLTDKPKGTGLGLPICKEIVEHHNGSIWLESELGKGSTFYFMLPAISMEEKAVRHIQFNDLLRQLKRRMENSHPSKNVNNATILVVDDDDGIRSLLKQELGDAGYIIEEASNGKEAISKIRSVRPDLVILDVMMPEMNGFDVAAILKNDPQTMEIPIIILSIVQDKSRGFRIGVDRYLTKPIDTALLFSEIGNLLEQGKSRKKVMVVDEDTVTVRTLTDVLQAKGYQVVESDGNEMVEKAIATQPDIIILNSLISDKHEIVKTLRFEKGLENVLFLIYQ